MSKTEFEFEQRVTVEQGAAFLEQVAAGLRSGMLELSAGAEKVRLSPTQIVKLELEASSDDDKQKLVLELKWHATEMRAITEGPELQVVTGPTA
jgi:amphi-Trp domain-containing protein